MAAAIAAVIGIIVKLIGNGAAKKKERRLTYLAIMVEKAGYNAEGYFNYLAGHYKTFRTINHITNVQLSRVERGERFEERFDPFRYPNGQSPIANEIPTQTGDVNTTANGGDVKTNPNFGGSAISLGGNFTSGSSSSPPPPVNPVILTNPLFWTVLAAVAAFMARNISGTNR